MKKIVSLTIACVMLLGIFTACGNTNENNSPGTSASAGGNTNSNSKFDESKKISVVSREDGSGTRSAFVELFDLEEEDADGNKVDMTTIDANITNSTSVVMTTVSGNINAIGYISLGSLNETVKAIQIGGVAPTAENVKNGSYEISRPFNIATTDSVSDVAQDFIDYIMSAEGQAVVEENGYIAIDSDASSYDGNKPSGKIVISGSSSVTPVMEKLKEAYEVVNPNAEIEIQQSDSSTGMNNLKDGVCDIGMASRALKDSETEAGLKPTVIAMDGIAVIVNEDSGVDNLTKEQVKAIFTGNASTWAEALA